MIFLIYEIKNKITLYEYNKNKFNIIKNNGEESTNFSNKELFWEFWKDKVQYQDENVGFIILTDEDLLDIPNNIKLTNEIQIPTEAIESLIEIKNLRYKNLISYPTGFDMNIDVEFLEDNSLDKIDEPKEKENTSGDLREYFLNKTREYKKNRN